MLDVIIFRSGHGAGLVVFAHHGDIGKVLFADAVFQGRGARHCRDVAQFRPVHEDAGTEARPVGERQAPAVRSALQVLQFRSETPFDAGLVGHMGEKFGPDPGVEQDIGYPARFERLIAAVSGGEGIREFSEDPSPEAVVAVDGTDSGAGQHPAQPGRLLDDQNLYPVPGRFDGRRRSAGSPAHDDHVIRIFAG